MEMFVILRSFRKKCSNFIAEVCMIVKRSEERFSEACVKNSVHGGHAWHGGMCGGGMWQGGHWGGHVGQGSVYSGGAWMAGGMHGRVACMVGACIVGGHVWWGACMAGGHAWQGTCMTGGMHGGGACVVDTMRYGQCVGGTHLTGMHSCLHSVKRSFAKCAF